MELIPLFLIVAAAAIALYVYLIRGIYQLATRYGRTAGLHTFLAVVVTPILPIIYLLCAGKTQMKQYEDILLEEKMRAKARKELTE